MVIAFSSLLLLLVRALTFQILSEVTKRLHHSIWLFLGNGSKKRFLTNWDRDNNTQGVHKHSKFWKFCSLSKIMSNKEVLILGLLEPGNDLRSIFVGQIHFKKLIIKFWEFTEIFHCCLTRLRNKKLGFF